MKLYNSLNTIKGRYELVKNIKEASLNLSLNEIFSILQNSRRRKIIKDLNEHNTLKFDNIIRVIAAEENDKEISELTSQERKRVYIGIHQVHLDELVENNIVKLKENKSVLEAGCNCKPLALIIKIAEHISLQST